MSDVDNPTAMLPLAATEPESTRKERRISIALSGFAFFISYVLTAGPAVFIVEKLDQPMIGAIVKVLYAPLVLIVELKVPLIGPLIEAWVGLFR